MIFVDASAIVAILTDEAAGTALAAQLQAADGPVTSALAVYEAILGIHRKRVSTVAEAWQDVTDLLAATSTSIVSITGAHADAAIDAFARYGKGQGHPAQLNMGDCFAYAVAAGLGAAILYTGNDFTHTDIRPA